MTGLISVSSKHLIYTSENRLGWLPAKRRKGLNGKWIVPHGTNPCVQLYTHEHLFKRLIAEGMCLHVLPLIFPTLFLKLVGLLYQKLRTLYVWLLLWMATADWTTNSECDGCAQIPDQLNS